MDQDRARVKEAYQHMTKKERVIYIFQNYWVQILIAVLIVVGGIMLIGRFTFNKPPENCLHVGVHAKLMDPDEIQVLDQHLAERFPEMLEDGKKAFNATQYYAGYTEAEGEEAGVIKQKLAGSVAAGMLDVIVGDQETLATDVDMGACQDLRNLFTEEELEKITELADQRAKEGEEGLVYMDYKVIGSTNRIEELVKDVPFMICITGGDEGIDACAANEPVYLTVATNAANIDNVKTLIWALLGENGD